MKSDPKARVKERLCTRMRVPYWTFAGRQMARGSSLAAQIRRRGCLTFPQMETTVKLSRLAPMMPPLNVYGGLNHPEVAFLQLEAGTSR